MQSENSEFEQVKSEMNMTIRYITTLRYVNELEKEVVFSEQRELTVFLIHMFFLESMCSLLLTILLKKQKYLGCLQSRQKKEFNKNKLTFGQTKDYLKIVFQHVDFARDKEYYCKIIIELEDINSKRISYVHHYFNTFLNDTDTITDLKKATLKLKKTSLKIINLFRPKPNTLLAHCQTLLNETI